MPDLSKLADPKVREALLLAEVAAWLHDMGKCANAFLQPEGLGFHASNCSGNPRVNPHKAIFSPDELRGLPYWGRLSPDRGQCARLKEAQHSTALWRTLQSMNLDVSSYQIDLDQIGKASLRELILWGRPLVSDRYSNFRSILGNVIHLVGVLGWAHKIAHLEKEDEADGGTSDWISSPFGTPRAQINQLNAKLSDVINTIGKTRAEFIATATKNFNEAPGDTRCPINEVTLRDWSSIVAALYKAELARCILTGEQREPQRIVWRLLSIRADGLGYILSAPGIPNLLACKDLLRDAWNKAQALLEETYPLGLEVYRDENGPVFVVPDIQDLDALQDSASGKALPKQILEQFARGTVRDNPKLAIQGELVPDVYLDLEPWKGQPAPQELPPIGKSRRDPSRKGHLERDVETVPGPESVANWWNGSDSEICTVCRLRPQGPSQKAKDRNVCDICEQRRADRSKEWALTKLDTTIWTDEVADANGRLALIVGQFDLEHWLSGDLVRTLTVRNPANAADKTADAVAKNPSFARLRRIWETTRTFWQDVGPTDDKNIVTSLTSLSVGRIGPRLEIKGALRPARSGDTLGPYHTYELILARGVKLSVVWDKENQRFITCDNLDYLAGEGQLSRPVEDVLKQGSVFNIEEPVGYGARNKEWGMITLTQDATEIPDSAYIPAIPILAEPRTFMALVPADKALDVVRAIKTKYEREMGKVRNRLPLHLGVVYAHRRMPLRAVLDAGRRMLEQNVPPRGWRVLCSAERNLDKGDVLPERFEADKQGQFKRWLEVTLERDGRQLTWYVPAVMGDGETEDHWYPYVFVESLAPSSPSRNRYFEAPNPWTRQHGTLVHAAELRPDDIVYFTLATFDFQWLDSAAQRFEIAYDCRGRRHGSLSRPYLLDEVDDLVRCWDVLSQGLHSTQIHALREDIEAKREAWFTDPRASREDKAFEAFCRQRLVNAEWRGEQPDEQTMDSLVQWAVGGLLTDAIELFHHIMKRKPEAEKKETEGAHP